MRKSYFLTVIVLFSLVFNSCNTEDNEAKDINGGLVYTSQVVVVSPKHTLLKDEYMGVFQGETVKMSRSLDDKLYFMVPTDAIIGSHDLVIPELDNTIVHYTIQKTVLEGTPEEVISGFNTNLDSFSQTMNGNPEAAQVNQAIDSFRQVFDNSDTSQKAEMATIYQANKAMLDELILKDYNLPPTRLIDNVRLNIRKNFAATAVLTIGLGLAYYSTDPGTKTFGLVVFAAGAYKAREIYLRIASESSYTLFLEMDGVDGENNRNPQTGIAFVDSESKIVGFNTKDRNIISSDGATAQGELGVFFGTYKKYNDCVSTVNEVITWVNANVMFANFSQIPLQELPETGSIVPNAVTAEMLANIKLSTLNPNITLVSYVLQSDGQIAIKIKKNNPAAADPIETFLYYTFKDGFGSFSGKIPIEVSAGNDQYTQMLTNGSSRIWKVTASVVDGNESLGSSIIKYTFKSDKTYSKTVNGNPAAGGTFGFNVTTHKFYFNANTNLYDFNLSDSAFEIDKSSPQQIHTEMVPLN